MWEINRVRLHSIGPPRARYADTVIDLSEAGTRTARFVRPSAATVLSLVNGGGKGVLLKLIFSVVQPGRRAALGGSGSLDEFVSGREVGHVAIEWIDPETGALLVTGKVLEPRTASAGSASPELWYKFRPGRKLSLATLPLAVDGRMWTLSGFRKQLAELSRAESSLQLMMTNSPGEWGTTLTDANLDPVLFGYQRVMNSDEGEAEAILKGINTSADFIKWLLQAITEPATDERLAALFAEFAQHVASFGTKRKELDFLNEVTVQLREFDQDVQRDRDTQQQLDAAAALLFGLQGGVFARLRQEQGHAAQLEERHEQALAAYNNAHARVQATRALANELASRRLSLRAERTEGERREAESQVAALTLDATAWAAGVAAVLDLRTVEASVLDLRAAADRADRESEPYRVSFAKAAANLARHYTTRADTAATRARKVAQEKSVVERQALEARRAADERTRAAASAEAERASKARQVGETERRVAQARAGQILLEAEDPTQALTRVAADQAQHLAAERAAISLLEDLELARTQQAQEVRDLRAAVALADRASRSAAERATAAREKVAELLGRDDMRSLVGEMADEEEFAQAAPKVAELVDDLITTLEATTAALTRDQREDERVLSALGEGGLLPPREDVIAATAALARAGIPAKAGWAYLEALSAQERKQALHDAPHLIDGVIVTDARPDAAVAELVEGARLMPRSTVLWSIPQDLLSGSPAPRAVVPVNPAMYDQSAAEEERRALTLAVTNRAEELDAARSRLTASRTSAHLLDQWAATYPPGTISAILTEEDATRAAAGRAQADLDGAEDALVRTEQELAATRATREVERSQLLAIGKVHALLEDLVRAWSEVEQLRTEVEELRSRAQSLADEATGLREAAELETAKAQDLAGEIVALSGTEAALRTNAGAVIGLDESVPADTPGRRPGEPTSEVDLAELTGRHSAAKSAYDAALGDSDVRADLRAAEQHRSHVSTIVAQLPDDVRARSRELAADPRAGQPGSRAQAGALAVSGREHAKAAVAALGRLLSEIQTSQAQLPLLPEGRNVYTPLTPEWIPTSPEHAEELEAKVTARLDTEAKEDWATQQSLAAATADIDQHRGLTARFEAVAKALGEATGTDPLPEESAYNDTPESADEARVSLLGDLNRYRDQSRQLTERITDDVEAIRATAARHAVVVSQAQTLLNNATKPFLVASSGTLVSDFAQRTGSLQVEIEQHAQHRDTLINTLAGDVNEALGALTAASRLSRLPANLNAWSGQNFLKIDFHKPEAAVLRSRVGSVVDRTAGDWESEPASGRRSAKRTGTSVLVDAVFAAVSGERGHASAFRVSIFQPDQVLAADRVPLEQMAVFSGGQRLTTGIIVYCTLAALRADRRGLSRQKFSGPLILDNPLGKANARHLIDLQLKVARALGVQLIFPSGVRDIDSLDAFPLLISLRNDRDLKVGRQYVTVSDRVAQHLPPEDDSAVGQVTGTRLWSRHAEELELPLGLPPDPNPPSGDESAAGADGEQGS